MEDEQPPAWATQLLQRIQSVEQQLNSSPLTMDDPNVVLRTPGADFTPPPSMLEAFPFLQEDFFRRPLEDQQRRQYLFDCPKNSLRNYDPPKLNKVHLSQEAKQQDSTLSNIQYRLSGLTRPLDWFLYQQTQVPMSDTDRQQQTIDFVQGMHELLSDLATHITSLRTDNMYKGLPLHVDAPPHTGEQMLVDTQNMLEHL